MKKEKREEDIKMKEFKRKINLEQNESMKRRKLASSLSEESLSTRSHGSTICGEAACKKVRTDNCFLKEVNKKVTVAAALAYRQLLCTQAFCQYTQIFLLNGEYKSKKKLYTFIYQLLPRFISVFD